MKLVLNLNISLVYETTIFSDLIHSHTFSFDYLNPFLFLFGACALTSSFPRFRTVLGDVDTKWQSLD